MYWVADYLAVGCTVDSGLLADCHLDYLDVGCTVDSGLQADCRLDYLDVGHTVDSGLQADCRLDYYSIRSGDYRLADCYSGFPASVGRYFPVDYNSGADCWQDEGR